MRYAEELMVSSPEFIEDEMSEEFSSDDEPGFDKIKPYSQAKSHNIQSSEEKKSNPEGGFRIIQSIFMHAPG